MTIIAIIKKIVYDSLFRYIYYTIILLFTSYLFIQVSLFLNNSDRLFGVDVASYLLTAESILNVKLRNITFLYTFPLYPILLTPFKMLPLQDIILYKIVLYLGIILISTMYIIYIHLLHKLIEENKAKIISVFLATLILISYRPFLEQYSWGGFSQFLSDIFGLIVLYNLIKIDQEKNTTIFKITFLSALSILSEAYSGIFWAITVVFFIFLFKEKYGAIDRIKLALLYVIGTILLSLIGYLLFGNFLKINYLTSSVQSIPNVLYIPNLAIYLFNFLFNPKYLFSPKWLESISTLLIILFIFIYKIMFSKHKHARHSVNQLTNALWFSFLIVLLITPAYYADRFLHFLMFPLTLDFIFIVSIITLRRSKRIYKFALAAIILLSIIITFFSSVYFNEYLKYYSFPSELLSINNYVDFQDGAVLSIGIQPFVAAYAAKTTIYPVFQPVWFTRLPQIKSAIFGYIISNGYYVVNLSSFNAYILLDKSGSNIKVYEYKKPYFINTLSYFPAIIQYKTENESHILMENEAFLNATLIGNSFIEFNYTFFSKSPYKFTKRITVDNSNINIDYRFYASIQSIMLFFNLTRTAQILKLSKYNDNSLIVLAKVTYQEPWYHVSSIVKLTIYSENLDIKYNNLSKIIIVRFNRTDILKTNHILTPITLKLTIALTGSKKGPIYKPLIMTIDDLMKKYNVKYIIISSNQIDYIPLFIDKKLIYKGNRILVYQLEY